MADLNHCHGDSQRVVVTSYKRLSADLRHYAYNPSACVGQVPNCTMLLEIITAIGSLCIRKDEDVIDKLVMIGDDDEFYSERKNQVYRVINQDEHFLVSEYGLCLYLLDLLVLHSYEIIQQVISIQQHDG
ncbi:hypothetical protein BDB01DRAFT_835348 [Pilobolus umbonatus]|nr:hypothetical protein BDB01DRAFT_835348 [Pilobolus umbonatus]